MLWKESTTSIFETYFSIKTQQKDFLENIENENNEGLSQIPNELIYCCMDLIKEQLLKH